MNSFNQNKLQTPIQYIKGVGPKVAKILDKVGIKTVQDFLHYFPRSYDDRRQIPKINQLVYGDKQKCLGTINKVKEQRTKNRKSIINAIIADGTGYLNVVWFNQPFLKRNLKVGQKILVSGKYDYSHYHGESQLTCSDYEIIYPGREKESLGLVVPIYSLTEGLYQWKMRRLGKEIFRSYLKYLKEFYTSSFLKKYCLLSLPFAVFNLHYPKDRNAYKRARERVVFDEFFFLQLSLAIRRQMADSEKKGYIFKTEGIKLPNDYINGLPFELTSAQKRVIDEIKEDLSSSRPMNRLIQGDVGSGKTEVAVASILIAVENGCQAAFMAPTEILAEQQYERLKKHCDRLKVETLLLTGSTKIKEREIINKKLNSGKPLVIVGTHALIQENVEIPKLGLAIVDEQHRFGVLQRSALKEKGYNPDLLFMTATPIPRSLLLTCYGDLDKSIIDEMPPGRVPQATFCESEDKMDKIYDFIKTKVKEGEQSYIVYPLVEESLKVDLKAAVESAEFLSRKIFKKEEVALIHGRMKSKDKEKIMDEFRKGKVKILVSTTVIEVGIDVPRSNIMVIMHAERFGLSQLHQLRGRIGRSDKESYCFLVADPKNVAAKERLSALVDYQDGFKIAEMDLKLRGPGDYYGLRQSGMPDFIMADLVKDEKLLLLARKAAFDVVKDGLNRYPSIENEIKKRREEYKIEDILH